MANRLTEEKSWKVLLIEAGNNENALTDVPGLVRAEFRIQYDWNYTIEPQENAFFGKVKNKKKNYK